MAISARAYGGNLHHNYKLTYLDMHLNSFATAKRIREPGVYGNASHSCSPLRSVATIGAEPVSLARSTYWGPDNMAAILAIF